ncbi:MAG: hypothetical protein GY851_32750 [bacterium]|nr:hypothetical protein [bacterium]
MPWNSLHRVAIPALALLSASCASPDTSGPTLGPPTRWDFDTLDGWQDDSSAGSPHSYVIEDGVLRISTRPDTRDRVKVCTGQRFGCGRYTWRVYVPPMGMGDQASIGAFLYRDDTREVDFEIGSGTSKLREKLNAKDDEVVCYCTTQGHPYSSSQVSLKAGRWYTLAIDLEDRPKGMFIRWFIDGKLMKELDSSVETPATFTIHCSVENLTFIGDHIPAQENHGIFDWVEFRPHN